MGGKFILRKNLKPGDLLCRPLGKETAFFLIGSVEPGEPPWTVFTWMTLSTGKSHRDVTTSKYLILSSYESLMRDGKDISKVFTNDKEIYEIVPE